MAYGKFAPVTSALLARKGEAAPSVVTAQIGPGGITPVRVGFFGTPAPAESQTRKTPDETPAPPRRNPGMARGEKRRVVLTLTQDEYERLGIAAVKMNLTRSEFAREALFQFLWQTARDHQNCACIAAGEGCACE